MAKKDVAGKDADDQFLLRFKKMSAPMRVVYARPRTFIAFGIGIIACLLAPHSLRLVTRLLIGWDVFVGLYLLLVFTMVFSGGVAHIRRNARLQDDGRFRDPARHRDRRVRQHRRDRVRAWRPYTTAHRNLRWRR